MVKKHIAFAKWRKRVNANIICVPKKILLPTLAIKRCEIYLHYFLNNYFLSYTIEFIRHLILEAYEKENIYICQAIADGSYPIILPCFYSLFSTHA